MIYLKKNKKGLYQVYDSISDERHHDKLWITEEEAKVIMFWRAYDKFMCSMIEIEHTFPGDYQINGSRDHQKGCELKSNYNKEMMVLTDKENYYESLHIRFKEICAKYKLEF